RWIGGWGALVAAGAVAVSPFAIHYSQETRMYILVALLGAASWYLFSRAVAGERWGWAGYGTITLALLYTHYYAVSLVVAQNLAWLVLAVRRRAGRAEWVRWFALQALLASLYLPWLWYSRATLLNWPAISQPVTLPFLAQDTLRIFSLGPATAPGWSPWLWLFLTLLVAAVVLPARRGLATGDARLLAGLYFLVPPGLMLVLSAIDRPFYNPKFLVLALPGYHLLLGHGASVLGRWLDRRGATLKMTADRRRTTAEEAHVETQRGKGARLEAVFRLRGEPRFMMSALSPVLALAALGVAAVGPLRNEFFDPRYWRDDYRAIARVIGATAGPRDAILLNGPGQIEIFDYYYEGAQPRYPLPRARPMDPEATIAELAGIAERTERLFAVLWAEREGDPEGVIEGWLDEHTFKASDRWFGDVRLAVFQFGPPPAPAPVGARFGEAIELVAASVDPEEVVSGEIVALALEWRALVEPQADYQLFAQVLDPGSHIVGQRDAPPAALPVTAWQVGTTYESRVGVPVLPGTPPGAYRLMVGLYDPASGARLKLPDGGDALTLATVEVRAPLVPPAVDALDIALPSNARLGSVRMLGSRASKLGFDHAPETPLRAGEPLAVVLFWQAEQAGPTLPELMLHLQGPGDARWTWVPIEGRYPPASWSAGEIIRDPQTFFLPGDLPPGRYSVRLEAAGAGAVEVGSLTVSE
ncbi:MAG TPA: hypothetical protein VER55_00225, partial [Ardenticatenaceae bacterium]|nr:hypothetical protein [Ardenticatenaceae bacterium]